MPSTITLKYTFKHWIGLYLYYGDRVYCTVYSVLSCQKDLTGPKDTSLPLISCYKCANDVLNTNESHGAEKLRIVTVWS